jgi:hypothetical protein
MQCALLLALLATATWSVGAQLVLPGGIPGVQGVGSFKLPPAQVAFGKPQTRQCEPWGGVWPDVDSVNAEVWTYKPYSGSRHSERTHHCMSLTHNPLPPTAGACLPADHVGRYRASRAPPGDAGKPAMAPHPTAGSLAA